ncbi:MAG: aldehyde dehydrogenase (NADP(+)) [Bacteroidota bacterium]
MITGKNLIGGHTVSDKGTAFKTFNPQLNQENDWNFKEATVEEIKAAVGLAEDAAREYGNLNGTVKARFLREIATQIEDLGDKLVKVYCQESGLPEGRAKGERGRTCFQLRTFANLVEEGSWVNATIDTALPDRQPMPKPDLRKMLVPIGPIAVFGASNFPLAYSTAGGDTASALAAGCPVIVKSHPMHAATGELIAHAILKAAQLTGMPEGVFSNLNSKGIEVGEELVKQPGIKGVGFTGSIMGGRALLDLASRRPEPIPVFAEMGSVNPVILLPEALQHKGAFWAKTYATSITLGTGQFCTNPGLLFGIASEALTAFTNSLSQEMVEIAPACMLHPNIKKNYDSNTSEMLSQNGVEVVAGPQNAIPIHYAQPILTKVQGSDFLSNPRLHQEVFGPFSMVVVCKDVKELETIITNLEGQLTGAIIGEDREIEHYGDLIATLKSKVGRLIYNGAPTGVEVCPAMQHGGPYPASTDSRFGAVGIHAIQRWVRPVCYQNWPQELLPAALKDVNPLGISRLVNAEITSKSL